MMARATSNPASIPFCKRPQARTRWPTSRPGSIQSGGTVLIPTGSRVQGSSWSQIQGSGFYLSDMNNPKVMMQVGNKGDIGTMEIVEMLFSVRGASWGGTRRRLSRARRPCGTRTPRRRHSRQRS
ncbi:hypothetical protein VC83_01526 [Pseudogymnoascus destructans]|uniref:Uncharacterized protein n=1 Tax=Pseudogymnoascus destructans TaxID=655981 RepID=A0A177AIU1_9PEZI|nr:uncharacterized protein VC83_01526 [Pseudogymnoascus destructans]OAF61986.1 hypothetical protein VC83_01526 [Pseudogymnoascus destructans]